MPIHETEGGDSQVKTTFKAQIKKVQAKYDRQEDEIVSVITLQMPAGAMNMHNLIDYCEKYLDVTLTDNQIEMWPEKPAGQTVKREVYEKPEGEPLSVTFSLGKETRDAGL